MLDRNLIQNMDRHGRVSDTRHKPPLWPEHLAYPLTPGQVLYSFSLEPDRPDRLKPESRLEQFINVWIAVDNNAVAEWMQGQKPQVVGFDLSGVYDTPEAAVFAYLDKARAFRQASADGTSRIATALAAAIEGDSDTDPGRESP